MGGKGRAGEGRGRINVRSLSRPMRGLKDADAPGVPSGKKVYWRARVEVEGKGGKGRRESNRSAKEAPSPRPPSHPNKPENGRTSAREEHSLKRNRRGQGRRGRGGERRGGGRAHLDNSKAGADGDELGIVLDGGSRGRDASPDAGADADVCVPGRQCCQPAGRKEKEKTEVARGEKPARGCREAEDAQSPGREILVMSRLDGIWKGRYPTKRIEMAVANCSVVRLRSSIIPCTFAALRFCLSM